MQKWGNLHAKTKRAKVEAQSIVPLLFFRRLKVLRLYLSVTSAPLLK